LEESLLEEGGHKASSDHSCRGLPLEDSRDDMDHRNRHGGVVGDNHPEEAHVLLEENGHNVHGHHNNRDAVGFCRDTQHHDEGCSHEVGHVDYSHPWGMGDDQLESESVLARCEGHLAEYLQHR